VFEPPWRRQLEAPAVEPCQPNLCLPRQWRQVSDVNLPDRVSMHDSHLSFAGQINPVQNNPWSTGKSLISAKVSSLPRVSAALPCTQVVSTVGILVFGPSAHTMEVSKAFSKVFMTRRAIPTAAFRVFASSQVDRAMEWSQGYAES
jgi:hypothetical protein